MTTSTRLKMVTSKNVPGIREAIASQLKCDVFEIEAKKTPAGVEIVRGNDRYAIIVGYDQSGKTTYTLQQLFTQKELLEKDAEIWTSDRVLGMFFAVIGTELAAEEELTARWRQLSENTSVDSIRYYSKKVAEAQGYASLVRVIYAIFNGGVEEKLDHREILEKIRSILLKTSLDFVRYEGWSKSDELDRTVAGYRAQKAAEWYQELTCQLDQMDRTQLALMNVKEGE